MIEFALFGSVLCEEFHNESDIDVMITFAEGSGMTLFSLVMGDKVETLFGRRVDSMTRRSIETSPNPIRRKEILRASQVIYLSLKPVSADGNVTRS